MHGLQGVGRHQSKTLEFFSIEFDNLHHLIGILWFCMDPSSRG